MLSFLLENWQGPVLILEGLGFFAIEAYNQHKTLKLVKDDNEVLRCSVSELEEFLTRSHEREVRLETQICMMDANHKLVHRRFDA